MFNKTQGAGSPVNSATRRAIVQSVLLCAVGGLRVTLAHAQTQNDTQLAAVRVWPSAEYTRVTLESPQPIKHTVMSLKNPDRLVVDLENVEINGTLNSLVEKIGVSDPYIKSVRVGQFKPDVVRLVFDLKAEIKPQALALAPAGSYGHRLAIDLYPLVAPDPLMTMLENRDRPADAPPATAEKSTRPAEKSARGSRPGRTIIIAIDPGHGGEDPGAIGSLGSYEKNIVLAISRKLKERIEQEPNMRAVLMRDGDYYVSLGARVAKARRARADLFVSVHADAFTRREARGSSVFALSENGASSAAASWLARSQNEADLIGGVNLAVRDPYLKQTLLDLSQTATINDSLKLAKAVLGEIGGINTLHKNYVEQAGFAVLKSPDIPSILVETAFITNPAEERRLNDDAYQTRMAHAIFSGVRRYFATNPPLAREVVARG